MSSNENNLNRLQIAGADGLVSDELARPTTGWDESIEVPQDLEAIQQHWERRGRKYGISPSASWVDETMLHHEGMVLSKYLKPNDRVLDAGCANGYTTLQLANLKSIRITGVDYAPSMIENANRNLSRMGILKGTASFRVGSFPQSGFP